MERKNKLLNSSNRSKNPSACTLKNCVETIKMKRCLKNEHNNIESKHTTSHISRNNVAIITQKQKFKP